MRVTENGGSEDQPGRRRARAAERRIAILDAALAEFSERGFAATRLDDVAGRAGVAKGTIYLHFSDKEDLFAGIIRHAMMPVVRELTEAAPVPGEAARDTLRRLLPGIAHAVREAPRRAVLHLLIAEGPRFPAITEVYFREIVEPGMRVLAGLAARACQEGGLGSDALARFPQLAMAPILTGTVWSLLFGRLLPIDVEGLVDAQLDLLLAGPERDGSG